MHNFTKNAYNNEVPKELLQLRTITYLLKLSPALYITAALLAIKVATIWFENSKYKEEILELTYFIKYANPIIDILLVVCTTLFITSLINKVQFDTIEKSFRTNIKEYIRDAASELMYKQQLFSPDKVFSPDDNEVNNLINNTIKQVQSYKFMSVSANYLLSERLFRLSSQLNSPVNFYLLLHDPNDHQNLKFRSEQMKCESHYASSFGIDSLKIEIVVALIRAFFIVCNNRNIKFTIRFHREVPLQRLEFAGDNDLFMSYFANGKTEGKKGLVAVSSG